MVEINILQHQAFPQVETLLLIKKNEDQVKLEFHLLNASKNAPPWSAYFQFSANL